MNHRILHIALENNNVRTTASYIRRSAKTFGYVGEPACDGSKLYCTWLPVDAVLVMALEMVELIILP